MENAQPGTLVMLCAENVEEVISMLKSMHSNEQRKEVKPAGKEAVFMRKEHPLEMNFLQE